ncbi:MAG: ADOP family duplicated permease [Blastocatellia bacterium]
MLNKLKTRLHSLLRKSKIDSELDEELRYHIERQTEQNIRLGMNPEEARYAARKAFGGVEQAKERSRDARGVRWLEELWQDLRYGERTLRKAPGWTAVMGATLALGVGLSTAIFSLTYSVLLRPLPYPDTERLVALQLTHTISAGVLRFNVNAANWLEWRAQSKSFEDIALARTAVNFNLTGEGSPERVRGARASSNLTRVLGVQPLLGRVFTEEETRRDAKVALLSDGFWRRRFAGDPAIVGRRIQLDGEAFEVIGVLPPEFRYPTNDFDVMAPLFIPPDETRSRTHWYYKALGRLKPGVSLPQAQSELSTITWRLAQQYPQGIGTGQRGAWVEPLPDSYVGQFRTTLYALLAAVGCLLLIGLINLGGLLIVRASARTHEFAVRAALGASAGRLRRQTLAETLPLSLLGGGGGALFAWMLLKTLVPWLPSYLPGLDSIGLHVPALAFALALSVLVALLAGMLPARLASRAQLAGTLQQGSRAIAGGGALRNALVAAQIAITLALVFAGGLLARSLEAVMRVNPGFSPQGVLSMHLQVTQAKYPTVPQVADYYRRLVARVKTIPGVIEAGIVDMLPFSGGGVHGGVQLADKPDEPQLPSSFCSATPGFFAALGIPLLRGRDFTEHDKEGAPPVAIIDEQLARKAFGDGNPLGKRIRFGVITDKTPWIEIVGVVGHIRAFSLEADPRPQMYWPGAQHRTETQFGQYQVALVIKTAGRPESFTSAVVEQIHKENPDQPVYDVRSMEDRLDRSLQSRHLLTGLVMLFVGSALLLACLGLYGVVSYGAALRLREFAIRTALGAQASDVRRLVLAHAARLWLWGSAIGLVAAWPVGRALKSLLYGVGSADAVALAVAPALLLATALLAGLGPARRAGRVDPAVTLRAD